MTRRKALQATAAAALAAPAVPAAPALDPALLARHDDYVDSLMKRQNTDPQSKWRGGIPDDYGLHSPGNAGALLEAGTAAFVTPASRHHQSKLLFQRMQGAAEMMRRFQLPSGNSILLITNFNSAPDTGFMVYNVAGSALMARQAGAKQVEALTADWRREAGRGLASSGVHTPNHRWVVCSALAMLHQLAPHPEYLQRINQWLAEGIDIDSEGLYTERSSGTYNMVTNRALIFLAHYLKKPELLEPVRRNLDTMLYLTHPDGELVTEISRRQDQGTRVSIGTYWLALRYLASVDQQPQWGTLATRYQDNAPLAYLLLYPQLSQPVPQGPLNEQYEKVFPNVGVARIRRGDASASIMLRDDSRFFHLRHGSVVIGAVRFASAFFGKGQFLPQSGGKQGDAYVLTQQLSAGYYQPFDPPRQVTTDTYDETRSQRRQTEVCHLEQRATITQTGKGFRLRIQASGTDDVPVSVELNLREGVQFDGVVPAPKVADAYLLQSGHATLRAGGKAIRVGPGRADTGYTQIHRALPKLPGNSIYLTGFTPFDHTLEFELL